MKTSEEIADWLRNKIAEETKTAPEQIAMDAEFGDLGLDSMLIVTLVADLEYQFNISLDPTVFWEYPTIEILSDWIVREKLAL